MSDDIMTSAEAEEAAILPRRYEVRADGGEIRSSDLPVAASDKPVASKSPAEWAYERLILYIKTFEEALDNEHEVAIGYTGADAGVMRIEGMGFFDPDIITFYGSDPSGTKTQLIQHVSQLNVLLQAQPKPQQNETPNRIGFRLVKDLSEQNLS